jgi:hypothetical protein
MEGKAVFDLDRIITECQTVSLEASHKPVGEIDMEKNLQLCEKANARHV